ncbi:hypothetical protein [Massilia sp. SYSU DXS3249]
MNQQRIVPVLAWACLSLLGACGGGGGEVNPAVVVPLAGSSPAPANPAPSTPLPAETSLVPDAGPVGAILYADAAPLRVLRPGATWTYRGTVQPQGSAGTDNIVYANKVSITGPDGQAYAQQHTNEFNLGASVYPELRFEGGAWTTGANVEFSGSGSRVSERMAELRSPVRVNDLYGIVERRNVDTGTDFDGDRINETASVAMYSRVVGRESLDLPNRRGLEAVRVDMTMRVRVTTSAARTALPVYESVRSYWYAPGIGVVKQRLEEPNSTAGLPNRVVTEVLENWDGLSEGLGYLPTQTTVAPASSPAAGNALQYASAAVGFDTHAVVAGHQAGTPMANGIMLAQLDARGAMVAARNYAMAELFPGASYVTEPRLVRSGDELRLFARVGQAVGMASLDATGQRILRPAVAMVTDTALYPASDSTSYRVAADGANFWIAWLRTTQEADGRYPRSAMVARVDGNGQMQAPARFVIEPVNADIHDFSMAVDGGRVGLSWYEGNLPSTIRRLATIDTASTALSRGTLDLPPETCLNAGMLGLQPGLAITCWNNTLTSLGGARIGANGQPVLANGTTLAGEAFKAPWLTRVSGGALASGGAGELYVTVGQYAPYWPGEFESGFTTVLRTDSAGGALAAREPVLLARLREPTGQLVSIVKLGNRLLLLGNSVGGQLTTTVVWLEK